MSNAQAGVRAWVAAAGDLVQHASLLRMKHGTAVSVLFQSRVDEIGLGGSETSLSSSLLVLH